MQLSTRAALECIGYQLDCGIFPSVNDGGIVAPSDPAISSVLGEEKLNVEGNSRARSRAGSSRRSASTWSWPPSAGTWPTGQAAPLINAVLKPYPQEELDAVYRAYPGSTAWQEDDGLWLLTESALLRDLRQAALFLTGISYARATVRSWGFWTDLSSPPIWMGPRHTNFPDGSICAFYPDDNTWVPGGPLVELLDLYSLWALRHLHLRTVGRWPGAQAPCHPYERLLEFGEHEYCSCGSDLRYGRCCRDSDLARNRIVDAVSFNLQTRGFDRRPPDAVVAFMLGHGLRPPRLSDLFTS